MGSVVVFGSAITSSRNNGAALFFRGLCRALARAGLEPVFAEEDRPMDAEGDLPPGAEVRCYATPPEALDLLTAAPAPRLAIKFVRCGTMDAAVEETLLSHRQPSDFALFVDGDAPVTLGLLEGSRTHYLRHLLPLFDGVLVLAGGERAAAKFLRLGARRVRWGYCAVDEMFWHPVPPDPRFGGDLLFTGNRLPDRDSRMQEFFFRPAALCPNHRFLLTGSGWENRELPPNVRWLGRLTPNDLRRAYASARLVLNVDRVPMAEYGYSPPSRLFEAAACRACVVSDRWPGIAELFTPGEEILLAGGAEDVAAAVRETGLSVRRRLGLAARERVERDHTCDRWVGWLKDILADWGFAVGAAAARAESALKR